MDGAKLQISCETTKNMAGKMYETLDWMYGIYIKGYWLEVRDPLPPIGGAPFHLGDGELL